MIKVVDLPSTIIYYNHFASTGSDNICSDYIIGIVVSGFGQYIRAK